MFKKTSKSPLKPPKSRLKASKHAFKRFLDGLGRVKTVFGRFFDDFKRFLGGFKSFQAVFKRFLSGFRCGPWCRALHLQPTCMHKSRIVVFEPLVKQYRTQSMGVLVISCKYFEKKQLIWLPHGKILYRSRACSNQL